MNAKRPSREYEQCNSTYPCPCVICRKQSENRLHPPALPATFPYLSQLAPRDFLWLLEALGPCTLPLVRIPETVVFSEGKASFLFGSKDQKPKFISNPEKLSPTELIKFFSKLARNRKKHNKKPEEDSLSKEIVLIRYTNRTVRVMSENEFSALMYERAGSPVWQRISYIQTLTKTRAGIGDCFLSEYRSDRDQGVSKEGLAESLLTAH